MTSQAAIPRPASAPLAVHTGHAIDDFRDTLAAHGWPAPMIADDGAVHRYRVRGDRGTTRSGWYQLRRDPETGHYYAAFGARRAVHTWSSADGPAVPV